MRDTARGKITDRSIIIGNTYIDIKRLFCSLVGYHWYDAVAVIPACLVGIPDALLHGKDPRQGVEVGLGEVLGVAVGLVEVVQALQRLQHGTQVGGVVHVDAAVAAALFEQNSDVMRCHGG